MKGIKGRIAAAFMSAALALGAVGCGDGDAKTTLSKVGDGIDYSVKSSWSVYSSGQNRQADVFLVAPTVDTTDEYNMDISSEELRGRFDSALKAELPLFEGEAAVYSPYYRQASMKVYSELSAGDREQYLKTAYKDVSDAFKYYLDNENHGRPIILAGFSQGADMCYRLLQDHFGDEKLASQLVACYAIGWACTEEMTASYPQIKFARGEDDSGVVVSFECEAEDIEDSLVCPRGTKMLSINPLTWTTGSEKADKSLNKGACFFGSDGKLKSEQPMLCGCYVDPVRGTLKVTDIDRADYPAKLAGQAEGVYHIYDLGLFFRNLQENIGVRIKAHKAAAEEKAA